MPIDSPPFLVGLTGGIGSGKSTVAAEFERLGVEVIDADGLAHSLTQSGGAAIDAIRTRFGADYLTEDGALDRARMRARVFSDAAAKLGLESILHPMIRQATNDAIKGIRSPYGILMVPLLLESGNYRERVNRVLVIDCPESVQIERVMRRSALTESEVRAIMAHQIGREERLAKADDVIDNSNGTSALASTVVTLHLRYLTFARA